VGRVRSRGRTVIAPAAFQMSSAVRRLGRPCDTMGLPGVYRRTISSSKRSGNINMWGEGPVAGGKDVGWVVDGTLS